MNQQTSSVLDLACRLLAIPSVTPLKESDYPHAQATLDILADAARASGASVIWRLPAEGNSKKYPYKVDNLYVEWVFGTPVTSLLFMGHTDVVPPGTAWRRDPFQPVIENGFLYGRGATDMKGAVAAFFTAMARVKTEGLNLRVGAIITTDEEWAAVNGSKHVLNVLHEKGIFYQHVLVGEPSSRDVLGSHIKAGRRGSLVGKLVCRGVQGHAAYPDAFVNPNRGLALAVTLLQTLRWDDASAEMPATNFEPVATESGNFNASAVIPQEAELLWNIRYTPAQTPERLLERLRVTLAQPPEWVRQHPDFPLLERVEVIGNVDSASVPYLSPMNAFTQRVSFAVQAVTGKAPVVDAFGGTTDGRFVQAFFPDAHIVELGPPERGGLPKGGMHTEGYGTFGGMHQADERIALADLENLQRMYATLVQGFASA